MNKTVIYILVSGASALAGGVAGYFLCKKRLQDKFDEELSDAINEELASIRKARAEEKKKIEADAEAIEEVNEVDDEKDIYQMVYDEFMTQAEESGTPLNEYRVSLLTNCLVDSRKKGLSSEETYEAINKMMAEAESPEEDDEEDPDIDEETIIDDEPQLVMEEYASNSPEVIPLQDYTALPPYFDFVTFHYFEQDDVLLDDGDMIVDDVDGVVGDGLVHFGECDENDDDTVYVVNGRMGLAIEIVRMHAAYSEWNGWGG